MTFPLLRTAAITALTVLLAAGCTTTTPTPTRVFTLPPQTGEVKVKPFGETFKYPQGLEITLSTPRADTPNGQSGINVTGDRAARFTTTITNQGDKTVNLSTTVAATLCEEDRDMIFSSADGLHGGPTGKLLLPGKSLKFDVAWSLDSKPCELQVQIRPTFGFGPSVWTGTIQ